jgi:hypothetical protein
MSTIEERRLKPLASVHCSHYGTRANFFVAAVGAGFDERTLFVRYESGAEFLVGISDDWSEEKVLLLIRTPWHGEYPVWEMPFRRFGSPMLIGEPSFVEGRPSWHFPRQNAGGDWPMRL